MNCNKKLGYDLNNYLENLIFLKVLCKKRTHQLKNKLLFLNKSEIKEELSNIGEKYNKIYIKLIEKINSKRNNKFIDDDIDFLNHINHQINMLELINENITQSIFDEIILNG